MEKKHPCDACPRTGDCFECALYPDHTVNECVNYECAHEYEGTCLLGIYSRCGAHKASRQQEGDIYDRSQNVSQ